MSLLSNSQSDRVIHLLQSLIRFPSLSLQETEMVDWLQGEVASTGLLEVERFGDNILFHLGQGRPWLLLNSHSDVVPPNSDYQGDPFEPIIHDGKIFGRGSTDAKGSVAAMITALLELAEEGGLARGRASFALTVCEETAGAHNGMHALRQLIETPDAAIVGEPTSLQPCIAQKGLLIVKLVVKGTGGHAARIYEDNALYKMGAVLDKLATISFEVSNPYVGEVKITPTMLQGGIVKNMTPDRCELIIDIRTIPEVPQAIILNTFKDHFDAEVEVLSDRFKPTYTPESEKIAQAAQQASGGTFFGSPTASDWVFLADIPTVKIGPGHSEQSHTRDESIEIAQLTRGVEVYKNIIKHYLAEDRI